MTKKDAIKVFEDKKIRAVWDDQKEEWYFSIVDVIEVLTDSERPRKYWGDLKKKLKTEGSQLSEEIGQLKLPSSDGKLYKTDVATTQQLFRLIQSIPSPKAEPFKMWMAQVAKERLDEMQDPELTINRAMMEYNLRDNMTNTELILNMLAETATTDLSKERNPSGFAENAEVAKDGGNVARVARKQLESQLKRPVISPLNAKSALQVGDEREKNETSGESVD